MVRFSSRAAALLIAVTLFAVAHDAAAQRPRLYKQLNERNQMKADRRAGRKVEPKPLDRAAMIARGLRQVGLTPEQMRTIRQIRARHDDGIRDIGRRFLEHRRQLELLASSADAIGGRYRPVAEEMGKLAGERAIARTMIEIEVMKTLTPEQRGKLRELRAAARRRVLDQAGAGGRDRRRAGKLSMDDPPLEGEPGGPPPAAPPVGQPPLGDREPPAPGGDLAGELGLTPEQKVEMRRIRRSRGPEMRDLNRRFRDIQIQIDDALLADTVDETRLKMLAAELGKTDAQRTLSRIEIETAIHDALTPQQRARLGELRRRRDR